MEIRLNDATFDNEMLVIYIRTTLGSQIFHFNDAEHETLYYISDFIND